MDVAVVGGGIAGIAAAARLEALGHRPTIYDPGTLGGLAHTAEPLPGWTVETGPHTFLGRSRHLLELLGLLGLRDEVVPLPAGARFLRRWGRLRRFPLALGEVLRVVVGLVRNPASGPSVRDWFAARFGRSVADEVVGAVVTGIWAASPGQLDMASCFPSLHQSGSILRFLRRPREPRGTFTLVQGLGRIGVAAQSRFMHVATEIHEVVPRGQGWVLRSEGEEVRTEAVVLAVPGWRAGALLPWTGVPGVRYAPILGAHWLSGDAAFPPGFGYLAAPAEGAPVLGTIFTSFLFPGRVPSGTRGGVTLLGGTREPGAVDLDDAAVRDRLAREHRALTGHTLSLDALYLVRRPRAVALPTPGHASRVASIRTPAPRLALAGAWCGAGAMDDAARSGFEAANQVCA